MWKCEHAIAFAVGRLSIEETAASPPPSTPSWPCVLRPHAKVVAVPQRGLPPTAQIVGVACGAYAAAAWDSAGVLYTWGRGGSGQLGHGAFADEPTPRAVAALSSVRAAAACFGGMEMAETHTGFLLVRTAKGALYSCGCSERGALGRPPLPGGDTGATPAPVDFPSELTVVVAMAAADNHAAAVAQDGSLYTWGNADFGKLGVGGIGYLLRRHEFGIAHLLVLHRLRRASVRSGIARFLGVRLSGRSGLTRRQRHLLRSFDLREHHLGFVVVVRGSGRRRPKQRLLSEY